MYFSCWHRIVQVFHQLKEKETSSQPTGEFRYTYSFGFNTMTLPCLVELYDMFYSAESKPTVSSY